MNFKTAVVGLLAIPQSNDLLLFTRDEPTLRRALHDGKRVVTIGKHEGAIRAAACSSDGGQAVSG